MILSPLLLLSLLLSLLLPGPCIPGVGTAISGGMTERRGITLRRFINTIAPQALENPLQVGAGGTHWCMRCFFILSVMHGPLLACSARII